MSKFDTHGGYFAPKDYMRINEGGSHSENPNGGVQVGVDEQGIPNMLEEGEPVYKDYVYSDNIKASERFLDANHIPVKYKDMLYSEIADNLFEEAEERPNDPVSRNGLEAMLGRLADAQEQQKQDSERRKLERELSKLSPDELEALQQELMAAQGQAQPQAQMPMPEQQVMPEEQVITEQPVEQTPVEQQIPTMANGGYINKYDGKTSQTGRMSRNQFAADIESLRDIINYDQPELQLPFQVGQSMADARTGFLKDLPVTSVGTNPYETGPVYSGTDFNEFLKWLAAYNGSRNAGHLNGTYAPDQKFNYGEYGNIKALEASAPYTTFTNDIIEAINGDDQDAKALAMRYLQAYNAALPESARGKIVDANGNLVDGWQKQYEKVRTYQPGVGHLSGNFQDMLLAYKAQNAIDKDKQDAIDRSKKAPAVDVASYIQPPVEESVDEELPDGAPLQPAAAPNSGRAAGPYFPTLPRYAGAFGAGLLAAYNAFTPADRYTATRYKPYVPVGHINLQNQRYNPVDQNMIQNQMLAHGNSTQRDLRNSGLGPSTGAAIIAADNNTTRNLGTGFLQSWQANNQQRNAVIAANNQAEGMRAQFDYGVDAARQRALNEAQVRNAQNDLMIQRLNYDAEGQKYNALSNQLNAGLNALAGIGRENFARNQANSNTTLEGYKTLGAGVGAHLPYYDLFNPVIYGALGGYLKKIKK